MKLTAPYFIHAIPYSIRIKSFVALSTIGMLFVALTPSTESHNVGIIALKLLGVVLASLSSGGGEATFLSLTHYYGHASLAAWSSGTGAAGLIGAGAYVVATTGMRWSITATLLACSCLPMIMLVTFFVILPREALNEDTQSDGSYQPLATDQDDQDSPVRQSAQVESVLNSAPNSAVMACFKPVLASSGRPSSGLWRTLRRTRRLIIP